MHCCERSGINNSVSQNNNQEDLDPQFSTCSLYHHTAAYCLPYAFCISKERILSNHRTNLVVWWSQLLTTNHEVPGSIPGSNMGIFLVGGGSPW